jgi:hypothetical protein
MDARAVMSESSLLALSSTPSKCPPAISVTSVWSGSIALAPSGSMARASTAPKAKGEGLCLTRELIQIPKTLP